MLVPYLDRAVLSLTKKQQQMKHKPLHAERDAQVKEAVTAGVRAGSTAATCMATLGTGLPEVHGLQDLQVALSVRLRSYWRRANEPKRSIRSDRGTRAERWRNCGKCMRNSSGCHPHLPSMPCANPMSKYEPNSWQPRDYWMNNTRWNNPVWRKRVTTSC